MHSTVRTLIVLVLAALGLLLPSCAQQEEPIRPNIRSMMASVPAGTARRATPAYQFGDQFAPQGGDLLGMMEIQGASYVVKAPASVAGGCQIECDARVFVDGNELWPKSAGAKDDAREGLAPATTWAVDILTWPDWVSSSGYSYHIRIRPLDGARHWQSSLRGFVKTSDSNAGRLSMGASLYQCEDREVGLGMTAPLACLCLGPIDKTYKPAAGCGMDDAEQLARASRFGIVFYVHLRQNPPAATTQPATGPAKQSQ